MELFLGVKVAPQEVTVQLVNFFTNLGREKVMWVGMVVVTELIRVRRLAMERKFAFQLASLSLNLLMMKSEDLIFLLSRRIGAPRYFPKFLVKDI